MIPIILTLVLVSKAAQDMPIPVPIRSHDPWVFRSVLDRQPRMVTLALSDVMWVSYDTSRCALYEAWNGGVRFQGAVYDKVHGPQPVIEGSEYTHGLDGDVWECWRGKEQVPVNLCWKGYLLAGQRCTFEYEVSLPGGVKAKLLETPEYVEPQLLFSPEHMEEFVLTAGDAGLYRSFMIEGLPADLRLCLKVRTDGSRGKIIRAAERETVELPHTSYLVLTQELQFNNAVLFFPAREKPAFPAREKPAFPAREKPAPALVPTPPKKG